MSKEFLKVRLTDKQMSKIIDATWQTNNGLLIDSFQDVFIPFPTKVRKGKIVESACLIKKVKFPIDSIKDLKNRFPVFYKKFINIVFSGNLLLTQK